jgi:hypothetical protein
MNLIDTYYCTCQDKKDIITAQLRACKKLVEYSREDDKSQILSVLHMLGLTSPPTARFSLDI